MATASLHRDSHGYVRVITAHVSYERLVERSFEKIRQAGRGMPAVLIRQLEALTKIVEQSTDAVERELLLKQAAMILRASDESVPEQADKDDVRREYENVLAAAGDRTAEHTSPSSYDGNGVVPQDARFPSPSTAGTEVHQAGAEIPADNAASASARSDPRPSLPRPTSDTSQSPGATR